jgi:hypothetical protein
MSHHWWFAFQWIFVYHLKRGRTSIAVVFLYVLCNAFPLGQRTGSLAHMASSITRLPDYYPNLLFRTVSRIQKNIPIVTHHSL